MKEVIIKNLNDVVNALDSITVSGKRNLNNLAGSINILEEVIHALDHLDVHEYVHEHISDHVPESVDAEIVEE